MDVDFTVGEDVASAIIVGFGFAVCVAIAVVAGVSRASGASVPSHPTKAPN